MKNKSDMPQNDSTPVGTLRARGFGGAPENLEFQAIWGLKTWKKTPQNNSILTREH